MLQPALPQAEQTGTALVIRIVIFQLVKQNAGILCTGK